MQDRIFTSKNTEDEEITLKFRRPTQAILSKAELTYRSAFSKAFRADIITSAEVEKMLRERGIWNEDHQNKDGQLRDEILDLEQKLEDHSLSNEQGESVCVEIDDKRMELIRLGSIYQQIADNTCETIANEARNQFLCAECIMDNKTGLRVYKDVNDYLVRRDEALATDAFRETVIATLEILAGRALPSDLTEDFPENKWKRERGISQEEVEIQEESKTEPEAKVEKPKKAKKKSKKAAKAS